MSNLVTVTGAIRSDDAFTKNVVKSGKISFTHEKGKGVMYYVNNSGGVSKNGRKDHIKVIYPNGKVKYTKNFLFYNYYPKVEPGATIYVGYKDSKSQESKDEDKIDWNKVLSDSMAQATSVATLLLLIRNL